MKKASAIIISVLIIWNLFLTWQLYDVKNTPHSSNTSTNVKEIKQRSTDIDSDVSKLVESSEHKVVTVTAMYGGQSVSTGSGAIYKVKDKTVYIVTNNHVIENGESVVVNFANGSDQDAEVVGKDQLSDLAVLKTTVDFEAKAFTIGDSSLTKKGEYIIAMGSPLGIEYQGSVSGGLISGIDRHIEMDVDGNGTADWDMSVLQTDAAINPGNSGGPLINMAGELIGINSLKITDTDVEGFGFAIPINEVIPIIEQLEANGKVVRPILGISSRSLDEMTPYEKIYYEVDTDLNRGLFIVNVSRNSPADKAGIKAKDVLITFDEKEVTSYKQFRQLLYAHKVGDQVSIEVNRNGKKVKTTVTLE